MRCPDGRARAALRVALAALALVAAACSQGGGDERAVAGPSTPGTLSPSPVATSPAGGGVSAIGPAAPTGTSGTAGDAAAALAGTIELALSDRFDGPNVLPVVVERGPTPTVNLPLVAVTLCVPGDAMRCQRIDGLVLDTGSTGLRVLAEALDPALRAALTPRTDAQGRALAECIQFADGTSWGPVRGADLRIGGLAADDATLQVIGEPGFADVQAACAATGRAENTVADFGANGVLGVSSFAVDCGAACEAGTAPGIYWGCTPQGCVPTRVPQAAQLRHPATLMPGDDNGIVLRLPAPPAAGAARAVGALAFGIGTRPDTGLGAATVLRLDPRTGELATIVGDRMFAHSFLDTGTNVVIFPAGALPPCAAAAPPTDACAGDAARTGTAADYGHVGVDGARRPFAFTAGNVERLLALDASAWAIPGLSIEGASELAFAWGLPFHFGRTVFVAIEGRPTPAGPGPWVAH